MSRYNMQPTLVLQLQERFEEEVRNIGVEPDLITGAALLGAAFSSPALSIR